MTAKTKIVNVKIFMHEVYQDWWDRPGMAEREIKYTVLEESESER